MTLLHSESVTAPFVWEPWPATGYDSLPAVIYRVGSPVDPYDASRQLSAAEQEALTYRWLPRTWSARRRYVAAVAVEEPQDVDLPPHLRPALVRALALSRYYTGGILFERPRDLGDGLAAASVLKVCLQISGFPVLGELAESGRGVAALPAATVTVGYLGKSKGRREALRSERSLVAEGAAKLHSAVRTAERYDAASVSECALLLKNAVGEVHFLGDVANGSVAWGAPATGSLLVRDLTPEGAREYVRRVEQSVPDDRLEEMLNLLGFLNSKSHRGWHRAELRRLRGQTPGTA